MKRAKRTRLTARERTTGCGVLETRLIAAIYPLRRDYRNLTLRRFWNSRREYVAGRKEEDDLRDRGRSTFASGTFLAFPAISAKARDIYFD